MMKKVTALLLALMIAVSLVGCGDTNDPSNTDDPGKNTPDVSGINAKELAAAAAMQAGLERADMLLGIADQDMLSRFPYYYGLEIASVSDCAIICASSATADEISILKAAEGVEPELLTGALAERCQMQKSSFELYSPESVQMLENAEIFTVGSLAVLVVAPDPAAVRAEIEKLIAAPDGIPALAAEYQAKLEQQHSYYDYSKPVPESEPKDVSWFKDAAFIGDSRMKGLLLWSKIEHGADYSDVGLNISTVFTKPVISTDAGTVSVADALRQGGDFTKFYIMTGVNELGWQSLPTFIDYYCDLIDLIREIYPEAQIYVMGIMPLGDKAQKESEWLNNDRVHELNDMITDMCKEQQVYFIDTFTPLAENGKLPDDAAPDGVHLEIEYCNTMIDWLLSHTVTEPEA